MKALFILLGSVLACSAIEKPDYELVKKDGKFEVRQYEVIEIVSAPMSGMDKQDDSFRKLFRYISGDNADKKKIEMTSPVFMEDEKMSFMIPGKVAEQGAPMPDGENVEISKIEKGTFAVLRFSGWNKKPNREKAAEELAELVGQNQLKPIGKTFFAFYNPPWTPEFMRRNEIWQRVSP